MSGNLNFNFHVFYDIIIVFAADGQSAASLKPTLSERVRALVQAHFTLFLSFFAYLFLLIPPSLTGSACLIACTDY